MKNTPYVLLIFLSPFFACQNQKEAPLTVDLIVKNANIWTADSLNPRAEALAVKADTIVAIGTNAEIEAFAGKNTAIIDAKGQFITPGFIDCHVHLLTGGFRLSSVQLRDAQSPEDFARRIADFAKTIQPGTWIMGGDWDHENWGGQLPERVWIDEFTPENPVWVNRLDGHMALANSAALRAAGIDKSVQDIIGGTIVRDANGELTGIFKDNAMSLVEGKIPARSDELVDRALDAAMIYLASNGVTTVHHMVGYMDALERARDENRLITSIYAMMALRDLQKLQAKVEKEGRGNE